MEPKLFGFHSRNISIPQTPTSLEPCYFPCRVEQRIGGLHLKAITHFHVPKDMSWSFKSLTRQEFFVRQLRSKATVLLVCFFFFSLQHLLCESCCVASYEHVFENSRIFHILKLERTSGREACENRHGSFSFLIEFSRFKMQTFWRNLICVNSQRM